MRKEALADIWQRHAHALRAEFRGTCPMSHREGKEAFRQHAERVFPSK
jgi:hypothetical protein